MAWYDCVTLKGVHYPPGLVTRDEDYVVDESGLMNPIHYVGQRVQLESFDCCLDLVFFSDGYDWKLVECTPWFARLPRECW